MGRSRSRPAALGFRSSGAEAKGSRARAGRPDGPARHPLHVQLGRRSRAGGCRSRRPPALRSAPLSNSYSMIDLVVPGGAFDLSGLELVKDVVLDHRPRPVVGRPAEGSLLCRRLRLLSRRLRERALVLVGHSERVADLVQCRRVAVRWWSGPSRSSSSGRWPRRRGCRGRCRTRSRRFRLEADSDLGLLPAKALDLLEVEADGERFPGFGVLRLALRRRSGSNRAVQGGPVDPLGGAHHQRALAVERHRRGQRQRRLRWGRAMRIGVGLEHPEDIPTYGSLSFSQASLTRR